MHLHWKEQNKEEKHTKKAYGFSINSIIYKIVTAIVTNEAASLAGTLGLGKFPPFYDDNGISIDRKIDGWFTDDTHKRFEAYGWHVIPVVDGHGSYAIEKAIIEIPSNRDNNRDRYLFS